MLPAITIRNVRKAYKQGPEALCGVDLEVAEGDFFALLGRNGAGKSTLIGILSGLVVKSSGGVEIFGHCLDGDPYGAKLHMGVVPQEPNFNLYDSAFDIVVGQGRFYGLSRAHARTRAEFYLRELGLWDRRGQPVRQLSGGMKRRVLIARALVHDPKLILLDEPTAGIDIETRHITWEFLRKLNERGTTILLTTHYLEEAEFLCRNIAIIDSGRLIENTSMKQLLQKLDHETFVLECDHPLKTPLDLRSYSYEQVGPRTLEIMLKQDEAIGDVISALAHEGVRIKTIRTKSNRLEQIFMALMRKSSQRAADHEIDTIKL